MITLISAGMMVLMVEIPGRQATMVALRVPSTGMKALKGIYIDLTIFKVVFLVEVPP